MQAYRVKGTNSKVKVMEISADGKVKVKNLETHEVYEISQQAFDMAFEPTDYSILDLETVKQQAQNFQLTESEIDTIIETAKIEIVELFGKCTLVAVQLANGFILTESTTSADPKNYNKDVNAKLCLERIKKRIWELEEYKYQSLQVD
ncbi:hypothetical protein HPT25_17540 [Bacillus sp. BRMEA1]|uniref:Gp49 family protein n=1 Tax=Neobacillus endophyticus TaxID=2738405 RepID=UPI00156718FC|nr:Gp49 family protein [Neobacillus endophyticus]NRD79164.1 hypothetical protein [Neobacillus endophyticus]